MPNDLICFPVWPLAKTAMGSGGGGVLISGIAVVGGGDTGHQVPRK